MEFLEGDLTSVVKDERSEFLEIDLFVGVWIDSEEIPENVVQFSFSCFVQDFDDKESKLSFIQESFGSLVVFVEVGS